MAHQISCSACRRPWTCHCAPGEQARDRCLFAGRMDDECAGRYLEAEDAAADRGDELVTLEVITLEFQRETITYRDGVEIERHLAGSAT